MAKVPHPAILFFLTENPEYNLREKPIKMTRLYL
jgi:hypothetical protein